MERNLDFDTVIGRRNTKCLKYDFAKKRDKQTGKPLAGVEFELTYAGGGYVDTDNGHLSSKGLYTTDDHGEIHISGIVGTVIVKETRPLSGYTIEQIGRAHV